MQERGTVVITDVSQRCTDRRTRFVVPGNVFDPRHYEVAPIPDDATARAFVLQHHYSASYPAARFRFGLYWGGLLVGVVVFSVPMNDAALACIPGERLERVELGRLVLLDRVPFNAETWTIARCFELLRRAGLVGVVSFSDPVARTSTDGAIVFPGHVGQIYQASNAVYLGRGTSRRLRLLPDGSVFSARAESKIRSRDQGARYSAALLERHGAAPLSSDEDPTAWLAVWLPKLTRPLKHAGNHKYAFPLDRRVRKHLPASLPYPRINPIRSAA